MKPAHPTDLYLILDHNKRTEIVMQARLFTRALYAIAAAGVVLGMIIGYIIFN
jgi:hypothetical protein